jgi:hypothetical protein
MQNANEVMLQRKKMPGHAGQLQFVNDWNDS